MWRIEQPNKMFVPAWQAQRTNQSRISYICTLWVPIYLSDNESVDMLRAGRQRLWCFLSVQNGSSHFCKIPTIRCLTFRAVSYELVGSLGCKVSKKGKYDLKIFSSHKFNVGINTTPNFVQIPKLLWKTLKSCKRKVQTKICPLLWPLGKRFRKYLFLGAFFQHFSTEFLRLFIHICKKINTKLWGHE